jgi:hypothetical protein
MLTRSRTQLQPHCSAMVTAMRRGKRPRLLDSCTSGTCPRTLYWYSRAFVLPPEPPVSNQRYVQLGATAVVSARSNLDSKIGENSLQAKSTTIWYRLEFVDQHGRACEKPGNVNCSSAVWSLSLESPDDFIVEDIKQAVKQAWRTRAMDTTTIANNSDTTTVHNVLAGISVAWIQVLAATTPPRSARKDDNSKRTTTSAAVAAAAAPRAGGGGGTPPHSPLCRRATRETVPTARPALDPGAVWSPIHHGGGEPTCPLILRVTRPIGTFLPDERGNKIIIDVAHNQCHCLCRDDHSTSRTNCISIVR